MTNEHTPLVSIICLTYNHAPYLRECLDSFLMQETDFPFEVIIHDDASTDGTTDIVKEYATKYPNIIKPIIQIENQYSKHHNFSRILHKCVIESSGKYIAICEGDDYWTDSKKLMLQYNYLESHKEIAMCYTKTRYYYQRTNKFRKDLFGGPYVSLIDLIIHPYCIPTATIMVRTETYKLALETHIIPNNWKMGDFPLALSVALNSKIHFIDKETSIYRVLETSACHFPNIEQEISFLNSVYDVKCYFINVAQISQSNIGLDNLYNKDIWFRYISHNNYKEAKKHSKLCHSTNYKDMILKIACSNILLFKLLMFIKRKK